MRCKMIPESDVSEVKSWLELLQGIWETGFLSIFFPSEGLSLLQMARKMQTGQE